MLRSIRTSIATVSISGTLVEKLTAIQAAGFDGVEIFENDLLYFDGSPADVRRIAEDLGLKIMLFQPFRDFDGVSAERLARNLERAKRKFDVMHELGTDRILVCSNVSPDTIGDDSLMTDQLGALARAAEAAGVIAGYEALAWGKHVKTYRHAWKLVDAVNHPNLGLVLDSFHTLSINDSVDEIADIPGERIAFVQIADAPKLAMDVLEWSRHYRCFPGQGDFDLATFTAQVVKTGYTRAAVARNFQRRLSRRADRHHRRRRPSVAAASSRNRRARCSKAPGSRQRSCIDPPAAPAHVGYQFLEFAVDDATRVEARRLARQAAAFALAGRHRSKDVTLYRHGAGSIVLNAEPDSFASAFFQQHGLSLCASAFRVDDARLAFERAAGLRLRAVFRARRPERARAAGRAGAGRQPQLFRRRSTRRAHAVRIRFRADRCRRADEVGPLERIDHVCLSLPADALDTWVLFFRTAFGFETEPSVLVPDPYGLVRSRAVRSRDGSVRIVLNASIDRHTAVVESLATYRGSGLNHVAFSTPDIFDAIPRLRRRRRPVPAHPAQLLRRPGGALRVARRTDRRDARAQHPVRPRRARRRVLPRVHGATRPAVFPRSRRAARRLRRLRRGERGGAARGACAIAEGASRMRACGAR